MCAGLTRFRAGSAYLHHQVQRLAYWRSKMMRTLAIGLTLATALVLHTIAASAADGVNRAAKENREQLLIIPVTNLSTKADQTPQ
jgi:hypothetical protein